MSLLGAPASSKGDAGKGVRALILAPTRELAHQIHNECLKLAQGRKWKIVLFSKATASTLADKAVQEKVGQLAWIGSTTDTNAFHVRHHHQYPFAYGFSGTEWEAKS